MEVKLNCILLVDDDEATNNFNKIILKRTGLVKNIQVATDGEEALDYLTSQGDYKANGTNYPQPELIFLDINMPGMSGFEFLEEYSKLPTEQKGQHVIIMLTTSLLPSDHDKAKQSADVAEIVNKPLSAELLKELIKKHIK